MLSIAAATTFTASAVTSAGEISGTKDVLFSTSKNGNHPYRIPAITVCGNNVIALSDYRICNADIGQAGTNNSQIDIYARISTDNGSTWTADDDIANSSSSDVIKVTGNLSSSTYGFGDAAVVTDSETGKILLLCVGGNRSYTSTSSTGSQDCVRFTSSDGGYTWTKDDNTLTDAIKSAIGEDKTISAFFFASGKILQSRTVKEGSYYRIYAAVLARESGSNYNYVLYSDDLGATWTRLGGSDSCCAGGDEAKVEELPNGQIVLSSRTTSGRYFNVFTYTGTDYSSGSWSTAVASYNQSGGISVGSSGANTNGELLLYKNVIRKSDGETVDILLQSLPTASSSRADLKIYYKELDSNTTSYTPTTIAQNWIEGIYVEEGAAAYSTMTILPNGNIGFLYEDDYATTYTGGSAEVTFVPLTVSEITGGAYALSSDEGDDEEEEGDDNGETPGNENVPGTTKTVKYRFKNVQYNGTYYYFYTNSSGVLDLTSSESEAELYTRTNVNESAGQYYFQNSDGDYMVWRGTTSMLGYNYTYKGYTSDSSASDWYTLTISTLSGSNVSSYTGDYVMISGLRYNSNTYATETAYFVIKNGMTFDGATSAFYNSNYSSAFVIEEVEVEGDSKQYITVTPNKGYIGTKAYYLSTFSAPFNTVLPDGVKAYYVESIANETATLTKLDASLAIPANTGVILMASSADSFNMVEDTETTASSVSGNLLSNTASAAKTVSESEYGNIYFLQAVDGVIGFYRAAVNATATQYKAYINTASTSATSASAMRFVLSLDDEEGVVTAIEDIKSQSATPAVYYNMQGVKVDNPEKGVFIMKQGAKTTKVVL